MRTLRHVTSFAALALAALTAASAGCSIDHRSSGFACSKASDCDDGRSCADGFCVTGPGGDRDGGTTDAHADARTDARTPDAAMHVDASLCPAICTSCDLQHQTCDIDCSQTGACVNQGPVTCPAGFICTIECNVGEACRDIECTNAASCQIECSAQSSCRTVHCGEGACAVSCDGDNSCRDVDCSASCACDVGCNASGTCSDSVMCQGDFCGSFGGGCSSSFNGCDTCH